MAVWVNEKAPQQDFNGALIVMNPSGIGDLSAEERDVVSQQVKRSLAAGEAVVRIYDKGVDPAPDWMDDIEDMCFGRSSSWMGVCKCCVPTMEMKEAVKKRLCGERETFTTDNVSFVGLYETLDGVFFFSGV